MEPREAALDFGANNEDVDEKLRHGRKIDQVLDQVQNQEPEVCVSFCTFFFRIVLVCCEVVNELYTSCDLHRNFKSHERDVYNKSSPLLAIVWVLHV